MLRTAKKGSVVRAIIGILSLSCVGFNGLGKANGYALDGLVSGGEVSVSLAIEMNEGSLAELQRLKCETESVWETWPSSAEGLLQFPRPFELGLNENLLTGVEMAGVHVGAEVAVADTARSEHLVFSRLPRSDPCHAILATENQLALFERLVQAFDEHYAQNFFKERDVAGDFRFYYFRHELQAFVDMFYATRDYKYLKAARTKALKAIDDANRNVKPFYRRAEYRGDYPTFNAANAPRLWAAEGTELWAGQLNDFQGAVGLMVVATALWTEGLDGWRDIADFVDGQIVQKWLYWNPSRTRADYIGERSFNHVLAMLDRARDKREQFAEIVLKLSILGYDEYPYRDWARFLADVYLSERNSSSEPFPWKAHQDIVPGDWGMFREHDGSFVWSWGLGESDFRLLDTSHANRTAWFAVEAHALGWVRDSMIEGLVLTFKTKIWDRGQNGFFFRDDLDGSVRVEDPGRRGNVWFGWHRLAQYDDDIRELFICMAADLTEGGAGFIPANAQNKTMATGPLALLAWGARLVDESVSGE